MKSMMVATRPQLDTCRSAGPLMRAGTVVTGKPSFSATKRWQGTHHPRHRYLERVAAQAAGHAAGTAVWRRVRPDEHIAPVQVAVLERQRRLRHRQAHSHLRPSRTVLHRAQGCIEHADTAVHTGS